MPEDAMWEEQDGMYLKQGAKGYIYYWADDQWRKSTKHLSDIDPLDAISSRRRFVAAARAAAELEIRG